jgi:hypothetical protein
MKPPSSSPFATLDPDDAARQEAYSAIDELANGKFPAKERARRKKAGEVKPRHKAVPKPI